MSQLLSSSIFSKGIIEQYGSEQLASLPARFYKIIYRALQHFAGIELHFKILWNLEIARKGAYDAVREIVYGHHVKRGIILDDIVQNLRSAFDANGLKCPYPCSAVRLEKWLMFPGCRCKKIFSGFLLCGTSFQPPLY